MIRAPTESRPRWEAPAILTTPRESFRQVTSIQMCWGKYSDINGNYYGENHDTVNFTYIDNDNEKHYFAILE